MQQEEILKSLNDFEQMIQRNFSEDAVESIETEGLRRSFRGLKNNVITLLSTKKWTIKN